MRCRTYSHVFRLEATLEEVFGLFSSPALLNELTPDWFDLVPLAGAPEHLAQGVEIPYALRWRGVPLSWTSRIVHWEPPHRLTYEQARGPYRFFLHDHLFQAEPDGTRVVDRVDYRVLGGSLIDRLLVRPDLERIFTHRAEAARRILGCEDPAPDRGQGKPTRQAAERATRD